MAGKYRNFFSMDYMEKVNNLRKEWVELQIGYALWEQPIRDKIKLAEQMVNNNMSYNDKKTLKRDISYNQN
jgi:hypothetical protein